MSEQTPAGRPFRSARRPEGWTAPEGRWGPDVLGEGFEARTLRLPGADEEALAPGDAPAPPPEATLVRYRPEAGAVGGAADGMAGESGRAPARFVFLFVHGWNDYFFHWETAELLHRHGGRLYALDLRGYGRSLREGQLPGYTEDLAVYNQEIDAAWELIAQEEGDLPRVLAGHSTGGLVVSLWAADHPGTLAGLLLNSPWLESLPLEGFTKLTAQALSALTRGKPTRQIKVPENPQYTRTLAGVKLPEPSETAAPADAAAPSGTSGTAVAGARPAGTARVEPDPDRLDIDDLPLQDDPFHRGWDLEPTWRLESAPIYAGWLAAVLRGQARVAAGLEIDCPILVLTAARSRSGLGSALVTAAGDVLRPGRRPEVSAADIVLDVPAMRRRALDLGPLVTVAAIDGAIHDVMASARPARRRAQQVAKRWLRAIIAPEG